MKTLFKMTIVLTLFAALLVGCASPYKYPECNDYAPGSKLKQIADDHRVCLKDVGNSLIIANGLAIGVEAYTAQQALDEVDRAIELLNSSVTEVAFRIFAMERLAKFPGLLEVSAIYMSDFNTNKYLDKGSKVIIQNYLAERVRPILATYAKQ